MFWCFSYRVIELEQPFFKKYRLKSNINIQKLLLYSASPLSFYTTNEQMAHMDSSWDCPHFILFIHHKYVISFAESYQFGNMFQCCCCQEDMDNKSEQKIEFHTVVDVIVCMCHLLVMNSLFIEFFFFSLFASSQGQMACWVHYTIHAIRFISLLPNVKPNQQWKAAAFNGLR